MTPRSRKSSGVLPEIEGAEIGSIPQASAAATPVAPIASFVRLTIEALYDANPNTVIDASAKIAYRPEQLGMAVAG